MCSVTIWAYIRIVDFTSPPSSYLHPCRSHVSVQYSIMATLILASRQMVSPNGKMAQLHYGANIMTRATAEVCSPFIQVSYAKDGPSDLVFRWGPLGRGGALRCSTPVESNIHVMVLYLKKIKKTSSPSRESWKSEQRLFRPTRNDRRFVIPDEGLACPLQSFLIL